MCMDARMQAWMPACKHACIQIASKVMPKVQSRGRGLSAPERERYCKSSATGHVPVQRQMQQARPELLC